MENVDAEFPTETKIGDWNVCADKLWECTNILLKPGCRYRFVARGTWSDADIACGPEGYNLKDIDAWKRPLKLALALNWIQHFTDAYIARRTICLLCTGIIPALCIWKCMNWRHSI